jgi:hypothetical protein
MKQNLTKARQLIIKSIEDKRELKRLEDLAILAKFMGWREHAHRDKVTNPKHPDFGKINPLISCFLLSENHPIVEAMYTDRPGCTWYWDEELDEHFLIFFVEDLKFDTSWDWLIPVIEEIKNYPDEHYDKIDFYLMGCNIQNTYEAVVETVRELLKNYTL